MLEDLSSKLESVLKKVRGQGKLTEKNIADSLKEIRRALLEADVNYKVVKNFITEVQEKALGEEVLRSITPGQQIVKIVYDELVQLMGESHTDMKTAGIPPTIVMICGLQGSGKTTFTGKLGNFLRKKGRRPMLVGADVYRPAAKKQLEMLGESIGIPVYTSPSNDALEICRASIKAAREKACDVLILDTAGRLHIDEDMMRELEQVKKELKPHEILFVADGMTGQDAVNAAKQFLDRLDFDGVVLTKMDGDARGGAALSIRAVTQRPIKFLSIGEKLDAVEAFHPDRMASRILGMGDVVSLVEKAQESIDLEQAQKLEKKIRKEQFNLEDFYEQLQQIKKMGPLEHILGMIPGVGKQLKGMQIDDRAFVHVEAIINSMTVKERHKPEILNGSRRRRIARGSGTTVQEVNQLMRQFGEMKKMMKRMKKMKFRKGSLPGTFPF
ncbi:MAG: signal recognition particle protein [Calditrichaeota bacterium]|nr:signal recognition particle protein [Calditrichota bacterium]MCB0313707.1 signal recognition particle protein [Calditrichota bacterium]MCB9090021.1 signal recognition particle protein [Calditrichia bacterium]